jgi:hypothetical protein
MTTEKARVVDGWTIEERSKHVIFDNGNTRVIDEPALQIWDKPVPHNAELLLWICRASILVRPALWNRLSA